jgi:NitT/TauT family transport system ATP-binding protein
MSDRPGVIVSIRSLRFSFREAKGSLPVLRDLTFDIHNNEFISVVGPSGSGKTTLLRVLAGLLAPDAGKMEFRLGTGKPHVGLVFQQANLLPWRRVLANITLPMELEGIRREAAGRKALAWIRTMGLKGFEHAWPGNLSGGMAQRVALARAFVQDPDLLLLDEPFGALDALTRERMAGELLQIWQQRRKTVVMVTHSIREALLLSDRVLVFSGLPARVKLELPVNLPRPRSEKVQYTPTFEGMALKLKQALS